ncbi:GntR family transcriptional regulator [Clostridium sp. AM58-1XD]|uniref:GntR family transcriptional regulator n=1 Tax=Clostridium sp. AM58-1XD TaxID=2292307 RepID=UPI0015F49567|nr:GntR family transcriptional regulator [Clostridium sp. AM58-1XD]
MGEKDNRQRGSVYMNICYQILDDIIKDKYSVGDLIPTQNELSERFHVSRATIREAVKELIRRGVLKAVKGKGTFVITKPGEITKDNRLDGFSGLRFRNIGREVHSKVIVIEEIPADKKLSNKLIVPQGDLITHIRRVRYVDLIPLCVDDAYLASRYLKGIDFHKEDLVTGSLYKILEKKADIYFDFVEEKYRAVSCPEELADYLEISHGEPVLAIERISCDEFGKPIEYCENYERSDLFSTVIQSRRSTQKTVEKDIYDKILGAFLGAAAGNALGAVTERMSPAEILEKYGCYIESFETAEGKEEGKKQAGTVTDSFSQAYFLAFELVKCNGNVTAERRKTVFWPGPNTRNTEMKQNRKSTRQLSGGKRTGNLMFPHRKMNII